MTNDEMEKNGIHASEYRFEGDPDLKVAWRGTALWAVTRFGACLNRGREWEHEPLPSSRDEKFFERCRFTLDEALKAAIQEINNESN